MLLKYNKGMFPAYFSQVILISRKATKDKRVATQTFKCKNNKE